MADVIASETQIVHDDTLNIDRQVLAGQPVPPDLLEAYADAVGTSVDALRDPGAEARAQAAGAGPAAASDDQPAADQATAKRASRKS